MSGDLRTNSILGAVLGSVLGVMAIGVFASGVVHPNYPEKAGYLPEVSAEDTGAGGPAAPAGPPDFGRLFADPAQLAALVSHGQQVTQVCGACHDFTAGGPNRTGPNLHDVFGRHSASHPGFDYSDAMKAHNVTWDYLTLNDFLTSPGSVVRGTKMAFAGIHNENDRVAAIAYLRSISPNNVPLPAPLPQAAPAAAGTATTTGTATTPSTATATTTAAAPAAHPTH
jgi:cytochrome c